MNNKRILVISNNPFSQTKNNGKTIESLFKGIEKENIAQLYFKNDIPDSEVCNMYYNVTEKDFINGGKELQNDYSKNVIKNSGNKTDNMNNKLKKYVFFRLLREIIWKTKFWKNKKFLNWLNKVNPDVLFFVAGDSIFAYTIVKYIKMKFKCKLVVYITDDYVLKDQYDSLLDERRTCKLKKIVQETLIESDLLVTISDKMRNDYLNEFKCDSIICRNKVNHIKYAERIENDNALKFVYAGSLYYGRDYLLHNISKTLDNINKKTNSEHVLTVYTGSILDAKQKKLISDTNSLVMGGFLNKEQLIAELQDSDILVFVESFHSSFVEKTKYSFSTKIPEYLSYDRCVLAIGPENVGSIEYLKGFAYCITSVDSINNDINKLVNDKVIRDNVRKKCKYKFMEYLKEEKENNLLERIAEM